MRPRVFVSSTYFDLRHVRERIEKFLENFGFESVLFESDKVIYEHDKPLDTSAYKEVSLCHMMILIIGGRYGSIATTKDIKQQQRKYENEYVSITRKEFETASRLNIPIFIFLERNVYSEYQTYKENQHFFDINNQQNQIGNNSEFKFAHVDNINVFRFIDILTSKPIKTFGNVEEIENYLLNQISGMFYLYLEELRKERDVEKVLDTVEELNNISLRMNEMLNGIGKKILGEDRAEYKEVIAKQFLMIASFFTEQVQESITIELLSKTDTEFNESNRISAAQILYDTILLPEFDLSKKSTAQEYHDAVVHYDEISKSKLNDAFSGLGLTFKVAGISAARLNEVYTAKVKPFVRGEEDRKLLLEKLADSLFLIYVFS